MWMKSKNFTGLWLRCNISDKKKFEFDITLLHFVVIKVNGALRVFFKVPLIFTNSV